MPMIMKPVKAQQLKRGNFSTSVHDRFSRIDQGLFQKIRHSVGRPPIRLMLGNGVEISPADALPVAKIVMRDRRTLQRIPSTRAHLCVEGHPEGQEASNASDSPLTHVGLAKG
jgi:hypothetical protein